MSLATRPQRTDAASKRAKNKGKETQGKGKIKESARIKRKMIWDDSKIFPHFNEANVIVYKDATPVGFSLSKI